MIAVDTNVLVHAHRRESSRHAVALRAVTVLAEGHDPWGLPVFCIGEFVRVVTHPRVFDPPSTLEQALAAVEALVGSPSCHVLSPGGSFLRQLRQNLLVADARGNLVFDAQIAAVCLERGVDRLLTLDRDFDRFPGIRRLELS